MDLKSTVNLPKTDFPQKGNLPVREPERLAAWKAADVYARIRAARTGRPLFNLHDGPPYANGDIHFGHVLNKVLKDFVVKTKTMEGFDAPYVPGWDCHGLPIEKQVEKGLEAQKRRRHDIPVLELRRLTREYAEKYVGIQSEQFQRLAVFGDWANPYRTMDFTYEADIVRALGKFIAEGSVYKGPRPVYWCIYDQTALAEAEVEFKDHTSPSVYVAFPFVSDPAEVDPALAGRDVSVVIWTTTPWTLPANLAIAFNPEFEYVAIETGAEPGGRVFVLAEGLLETVAGKVGWQAPRVLARFKGSVLEHMRAHHPFADRESLFVLADYVTLDAGTGAVHTAPGHGHEDYVTGLRYGLEVYCPVDHAGNFTADVAHFAGQRVFEANPGIVKLLEERGALLEAEKISHSYAHCWRCNNPLIYRATPQWFVSMDKTGLRARAVDAIRSVDWVPSWGEERMVKMIENRPDWCISRQRAWGVPITVFACDGCGELLLDEAIFEHVARIFEHEGADAWYSRDTSELLPAGTTCPRCGHGHFIKENDILDVWIDSGVSSLAVVERRGLGWPADMYLEGNDQFRGWFNSSLMVGVETRGAAPYRTVLVHGMTVDEKGEKLSKSKGNTPDLAKFIKANGAEILRLWSASVNYREEVPLADEHLKRLSEAYRKIRNTVRYALGNLDGFDPVSDRVPYPEMLELDRWALSALNRLTAEVREAYGRYEFHTVYHALYNFCTVELSSIYFDVLKDRLYTHAPRSRGRRSAQTALYEIIHRFTRLIAPILAFTAEEVWEHIPGARAGATTVHATEFPVPEPAWEDAGLDARWARLLEARDVGQKALEARRAAKEIGSSLEAVVTIRADGELFELLSAYRETFEDLLIVSGVELERGDGALEVAVRKADAPKCERCWHYRSSVGEDEALPTVCGPCREHLREGWPELVTA